MQQLQCYSSLCSILDLYQLKVLELLQLQSYCIYDFQTSINVQRMGQTAQDREICYYRNPLVEPYYFNYLIHICFWALNNVFKTFQL